mmetsp:Transcript_9059/g.18321  ORF Transcript_9059/g.18321 Transcript_9059/m.18321 type:complete len:242 (+) Transcript_9059:95-820(+)
MTWCRSSNGVLKRSRRGVFWSLSRQRITAPETPPILEVPPPFESRSSSCSSSNVSGSKAGNEIPRTLLALNTSFRGPTSVWNLGRISTSSLVIGASSTISAPGSCSASPLSLSPSRWSSAWADLSSNGFSTSSPRTSPPSSPLLPTSSSSSSSSSLSRAAPLSSLRSLETPGRISSDSSSPKSSKSIIRLFFTTPPSPFCSLFCFGRLTSSRSSSESPSELIVLSLRHPTPIPVSPVFLLK